MLVSLLHERLWAVGYHVRTPLIQPIRHKQCMVVSAYQSYYVLTPLDYLAADF